MPVTIDYYMSLNSPWTYLGSAPFAEIAGRSGATVNIKPCKFGPIFEQTGGLPLPKRSPQRRAYRMVELKRWREVRSAPIHLEPKYFPCDDAAAVRLVIAAKLQGKNAHRLSIELGRALWEREETLADPATMASAAERAGLDAAALRADGRSDAEIDGCAELRAAFGRDLLGPGPPRPAGTRFEKAGALSELSWQVARFLYSMPMRRRSNRYRFPTLRCTSAGPRVGLIQRRSDDHD